MVRTVVDTNVLISAFIADGLPNRFFRHCLAGRVTLILSPPMLEEFAEVLRRPKIRLSSGDVLRAVQVVAEAAEIVEARDRRGLVPKDPDDDMIVSTAVDGRAEYIVTGDRVLLDMGAYQGIKITSVKQFLEEVVEKS